MSEILPLINYGENGKILLEDCDGTIYKVSCSTQRLICFKLNQSCVKCGIKGEYFALEKTAANDASPHLNMYAVLNGEEILMTKDHYVPQSKGGNNDLDNLQTMCSRCNRLKDNITPKVLVEDLSCVIFKLFKEGKTDRAIESFLKNNGVSKIGFTPTMADLIAIIRKSSSN
jgi:5-methylcytosine-specific restriction endonuclease McrA